MVDFVVRANSVKLKPDWMIEANERVNKLIPEDRRDLTARSLSIIMMMDDLNISDRRRGDIVSAISFRMEALARLEFQHHKEMNAWTLPGNQPGMVFAHEDLLRVAASEPLIAVDERTVEFEPNRFFQSLLALSKARGNG